MAFLSRVGSILKQSVSKQITSQVYASNPSIYQSLRCMSSSKLFVGGLPWGVDDSSLRDAFSQYGDVVEGGYTRLSLSDNVKARVIIDREQNRSRGFGFVTFASTEEASSAIQAMDGQDLQGRTVRVNYATERAPRPYGGGGFGGQNYGGGGYSGGQNYGGGSYNGGPQQYGGGGYNGGASQQYGGGSGGFNSGGGIDGFAGGVGDSLFGGGAAGSDFTAKSDFGSSGFEDGSGVGQLSNSSTGAVQDDAGQFESSEPLEESFKDDGEPDDYAKRA